jgi:hypothetical protein
MTHTQKEAKQSFEQRISLIKSLAQANPGGEVKERPFQLP